MPRNPTVHPSQRISVELQERLNNLIKDNDCNKYQFASSVGVSKEVISRACLYGIIPSLQSTRTRMVALGLISDRHDIV